MPACQGAGAKFLPRRAGRRHTYGSPSTIVHGCGPQAWSTNQDLHSSSNNSSRTSLFMISSPLCNAGREESRKILPYRRRPPTPCTHWCRPTCLSTTCDWLIPTHQWGHPWTLTARRLPHHREATQSLKSRMSPMLLLMLLGLDSVEPTSRSYKSTACHHYRRQPLLFSSTTTSSAT